MRRLIKKIVPAFQSFTDSMRATQRPRFACREKARSANLDVYVPGVPAGAVELAVHEDELVVTARKTMPVRQNFRAAHIEAMQPDYLLRVQLGQQVDPTSIWAALRDGVLTIHLKKTKPAALRLSVA